MITVTHYRKFIEQRLSHLGWTWNSVRHVEVGYARFYCAVVTDGVRHHTLRRKCRTSTDALLYGARMTRRVNGFTDVNHSVLAHVNKLAVAP